MLINLRNAMMTGKRLPYDSEVEYLQSSGTQWIDTGYSFNSATDKVELVFELLTTTPDYKWVFGAYDATGGQYRLSIGRGWGTNRKTFGYGTTTSYVNDNLYYYGPHNYVADTSGAGIDGTTLAAFANFATESNIFLFSIPLYLTAYCSNSRIWSHKHYRNNTLVRDYIPVRKGTVGYLYDRVSGKLFGNAGTGDFVLGPDVVPVEYIESHGTEWIDTGVKVADPSTISISADSDGVTPFGTIHNNVGTGTWLGINYRTSATEVAVYSKGFNSRGLFEFSAGRHTFKWDGATGFLIDGVSQSAFTATVGTDAIGSISWPLFGRYDFHYSSVNGLGSSKFYGANIEISGAPTRKYLPIRVGTDATSWEGAMMDVLTRRIYRNARTGAFTYGNDLKYPIPAS